MLSWEINWKSKFLEINFLRIFLSGISLNNDDKLDLLNTFSTSGDVQILQNHFWGGEAKVLQLISIYRGEWGWWKITFLQEGRLLVSNVWGLKGASICQSIAVSALHIIQKIVVTMFLQNTDQEFLQ